MGSYMLVYRVLRVSGLRVLGHGVHGFGVDAVDMRLNSLAQSLLSWVENQSKQQG